MDGYEGGLPHDDYADEDLRALRRQEEELENRQDADRRMRACEDEKKIRRDNIRKLGGKPIA